MKKLLKEHSLYILIFTLLELIFAVIAIIGFVYEDVIDLSGFSDVATLIENLYSQTWWGMILMSLSFSCILSITTIVYKKLDYYFISIGIWIMLAVIAINLNATLGSTLYTLILFIPIILIKIICYKQEKDKLNKKKLFKKKK